MHKESTIFFPKEDLSIKATDLAQRITTDDSELIQKVASVCRWWYDNNEPLSITTSGTTGTPKVYHFERSAVKKSIRMTTEALDLKPGMRALLAIDSGYIGGRMMILRALHNAMNLVCIAPSGNPLEDLSGALNIDFAAFVPLQIDRILSDAETADKFKKIKRVLIGGAPVSVKLSERLKGLSNRIYETFGMTETLSHIALKNLSNSEEQYVALPGVTISTDDRGCMVVEAEGLIEKTLITSDLIYQKNEKEFTWAGRIDRQINSGGIKISPETLEKKCEPVLSRYLGSSDFFFDWVPDELLGQKTVLVLIGKEGLPAEMPVALNEELKGILTKYEMPKAIYLSSEFYLTPGGKTDRKATLKSAEQIWP